MDKKDEEQTHDIYGTQHAFNWGKEPVPKRERREQFWSSELRRTQRSAFFTGLAVVITLSIISTVAILQYLNSTAPNTERAKVKPPPAPARNTAATPLDVGADPQSLFLTDELSTLATTPATSEGDRPLEVTWVKQVAFHLVQAEKAIGEARDADAVDQYLAALKIFPDMKGVYQEMGMIYLRMQEYASAAEALETAAREDPMSFGIANNMGVAYLQLEDYDKAEARLRQALRLKPDYAAAVFNLATLHLRREEMQEASSVFSDYLELQPRNLQAAQTYAYTLLQTENWEKAVEVLSAVAQQRPDSAPVFFRLAQALSHSGQTDEAILNLRRATDLVDARHALSWMSRTEFDKLRANPDFQNLLKELGSTGS